MVDAIFHVLLAPLNSQLQTSLWKVNRIILFKSLRHLFLLAVLRIRALVVGRLDILSFSFTLLLKFQCLKYSCVQVQLRKVRLSSDSPVCSPTVCLLVHLGIATKSPVFWYGLTQQITRCFTSIRILVSMEGFSWHIGMYLYQLALGIPLPCFKLSYWRKIPLLSVMTSEIQTPKNKRCYELQLSRDVKRNQKLLSKCDICR